MSNVIDKTIEELCLPQTSSDLWNEINQETNPNNMLLYLTPNVKMTLRFLGPFMSIMRFYAPYLKSNPKIDIEAIANKNPGSIQIAIDYFKHYSGRFEKKTAEYLKNLEAGNIGWQRCTMVNAYVVKSSSASGVKVLAMPRGLSDVILDRINYNPNIPLSGFFAHNVCITRRGEALQTVFEVKLEAQSWLNDKDMNTVLSNGLIDIPTLISHLNRAKNSSYYYKKNTGYKMPTEYMKSLLEEKSHREIEHQLKQVEEHLDEMPVDALERRNNMREAIGSLEL